MNECKKIGCPALCCKLTVAMQEWKPDARPVGMWSKRENGDYVCDYLSVDNECTIYNERPTICRNFEFNGSACNTLKMKFIV